MRVPAARRRAGVARLVLIAALAAGGCGDGETGRWAGSVDTLPDGTVHVQNPAEGTWTRETRPRLQLELAIGRATGAEPYLFGDVRDLTVDGMGRIWVLDNQSRQVRVFGPDGEHVRTVGGEGQGPGEFRNPNGLARDPTTGRVWVVDPANARYTVFDTAGRLVETIPRQATGWGYAWPGRFDDGGRLRDFVLGGTGEVRFRGIVRRTADGDPLDSLRLPSYESWSSYQIEQGDRRTVTAVPYSARPAWALSPRGSLWWTVSGPYALHEISHEGDTLRLVEREHEPVPVTDPELDSVRRSYDERFGEAARQVDFSRIPDRKPAIREVFVSRAGRLWVLPYGGWGETGRLADVFTPAGRYLGRLELPVRLRWYAAPVITEEALYGVRADPATGVHQVVRLSIDRGGS